MKKFMAEFKEFIAKGDAMSMAVGIIIGSAFTAIVNSLVNDVITPILGIILGGINFTGVAFTVGGAHIMIGNFIQAVITCTGLDDFINNRFHIDKIFKVQNGTVTGEN